MMQNFSLRKLNVPCMSYNNGKLAQFDRKLKMSIPVETKVNTTQQNPTPPLNQYFILLIIWSRVFPH